MLDGAPQKSDRQLDLRFAHEIAGEIGGARVWPATVTANGEVFVLAIQPLGGFSTAASHCRPSLSRKAMKRGSDRIGS